jgi:hypothetical protein
LEFSYHTTVRLGDRLIFTRKLTREKTISRTRGPSVCRLSVGFCKFVVFKQKVSERGGTGKDFMDGKICLTNLKSCRYRHLRIEKSAKRVGEKRANRLGRNPQTLTRGRATRAPALVAPTHPDPPICSKTNVTLGGIFLPYDCTAGRQTDFHKEIDSGKDDFSYPRSFSLSPIGWFV